VAELLTKRVARRVLAAGAAAAMVGSVAVAQSASAQSVALGAVKVTVTVVGPVPSGVSGYLAAVTCNNLAGISSTAGVANAGSQTLSALFGTTGGSQDLLYTLNAANAAATPAPLLGSNCSLNLTVTGTANLAAAGFGISYGGAVSGQPFFFSRGGATAVTPIVPVTGPTTIAITVAYPQLTVKKVVVGDEPTAGFAYPMSVACANQAPAAFLLSTLSTYTIPQDINAVTGADLANIKAFVVNNGFIQGPSGNRYFNNGTFANVNDLRDFVAGATTQTITTVIPPVGAVGGFTGTFSLANNASRTFGINEFPLMNSTTKCEVTETDGQGSALGYSSTNGFITGTTTPAPALLGVLVGGVFKSALTSMNNTVTVTNTYAGDLVVSKVVTGDPRTNIAVYEISVACDKGGPKETFLLRDRQSKVYSGVAAGVNCLVTETRSDGATASYTDNSGDNTTDGRVTIRMAVPGCGQGTNVVGSNNCIASVIVTNSYVPPTTTAAPTTAAPATAAPTTAAATTAAPTTAAAAPTTAAPAVTAAPAPEVEAEATFTG